MNAIDRCPFPAAWTPHQIAEAISPRLHELDFGLPRAAEGGTVGRPRHFTGGQGYLPQPALSPRFRING